MQSNITSIDIIEKFYEYLQAYVYCFFLLRLTIENLVCVNKTSSYIYSHRISWQCVKFFYTFKYERKIYSFDWKWHKTQLFVQNDRRLLLKYSSSTILIASVFCIGLLIIVNKASIYSLLLRFSLIRVKIRIIAYSRNFFFVLSTSKYCTCNGMWGKRKKDYVGSDIHFDKV